MKTQIPTTGSVFWLEEAMEVDQGQDCPPLVGDVQADVCIVGGGYLGLWSAIEILQRSPESRVVIIEAEACGFGASGRNGGWVTGWHDELPPLISNFGLEEALRLAQASSEAIDRLESFCRTHSIDCRMRREGATKAAVTPVQRGRWSTGVRACQENGRGHLYKEVSGEELRARTGSPLPLEGVAQTDGATVQPALLARGLRRVALELGARIYEGTSMIGLERDCPALVRTPAGSVTARKVVLAMGAHMAAFKELRRAIVPVGSSIIVTEPLGDALLSRPFANGEGIGDQRMTVHYMQVTTDGRLMFGRGGGPLGPYGRIHKKHWFDEETIGSIIGDFERWFPDLASARITHAWTGAVDRAPSHFPFIGTWGKEQNIHYISGLSGNGVGPAVYLGQVLSKLALDIRDADTQSRLTRGPVSYLPPEPARSLGGYMVRAAVEYVEEAQELGSSIRGNGILRKLIGTTTPRFMEPRLWRS